MVDRVPANPEAEGTEPDPGPTILQTVPVEDYDESRVVPATEEDRQLPVMPVLLQSVSSSVRTALVIVVFTIVLFAIIGGVLSFQNLSPASLPVITVPPVISPATPSPIITIPIVTPVPRNTIPTDGVWIRASYNGSYIGLYGNPGSLQHVRGSGDMFYRIRDNGGLVQASFQKQDNSGETLGIEVYRNGSVIATRSVRAPMGSIDFIIDSATGSFPGGIPSRPSATGLVPGKIYR